MTSGQRYWKLLITTGNKLKIYFNRPIKNEAWGGGAHFITSFCEYLSEKDYKVVFQLEPGIDVIFMFDPRPHLGGDCVNSIYRYIIQNPNTKVIQRINDTDKARPGDPPWRDNLLLESNRIADSTIFISEWVRDYYVNLGFDKRKENTVIINGCKEAWYFSDKNKRIDNSKINLITHHWSDNFMKGLDVYNFIDDLVSKNDNITFTYMGRYNKSFNHKNTNIISPKYGPEIGEILRSADIYVTGARWEACGMHHIEAARCGLPVLYHRDGGGVTEVCKNHGIEFSNLKEFKEKLEIMIKNYDNIRSNIDYNFLSSLRCFKEYENAICKSTSE